jgi:lipocalin
MKAIFTIIAIFALIQLNSAATRGLPYDFQGQWMIAASWGLPNQDDLMCPRASFDITIEDGFSFTWEAIDYSKYTLAQQKTFFRFKQDGDDITLEDSFCAENGNWKVLFFDHQMRTAVIVNEQKNMGMILSQGLNVGQYIETIMSQLSLTQHKAALQVFPEFSCQFDHFPQLPAFKAESLVGKWWASASIGGGANVAQPGQCMSNQVSMIEESHEIAFRFEQAGMVEEELYLPKPSEESFFISSEEGHEGDFSGAVVYVSKDKSFWIFMFTNGNRGEIFSKNASLTQEQISEAVSALKEQGYNVESGKNLAPATNNSHC